MANEKLTDPKMSIMEMIMTMSEYNPGAIEVLSEMLNEPYGLLDILSLDSLDIRGFKIWILSKDCCNRDKEKLKRTIKLLRFGLFTQEQIDANLNLSRAVPFVDDTFDPEGYFKDGYNEEHKEQWQEYCRLQKETFTKKLEEALKQEEKFNSIYSK